MKIACCLFGLFFFVIVSGQEADSPADEFKWLEQTDAASVKKWINDQNQLTNAFFRRESNVLVIEEELEAISSVRYNSAPRQGKYYFEYYFTRVAPTPSLYFKEKLTDPPRMLIDPREVSLKDQIQLGGVRLSPDGKHIAWSFLRNGSDWQEIRIRDLRTKKDLDDRITDVRYSDISWDTGGFYYIRYPRSEDLFQLVGEGKLWYHQLGTTQEKDLLIHESIFGAQSEISTYELDPGHAMILYDKNESEHKYQVWYIDLRQAGHDKRLLFSGTGSIPLSPFAQSADSIVAISRAQSNTGEIVSFAIDKPDDLRTLVAGLSDGVLVEAEIFGDRIVTVVQSQLSEYMVIYDRAGSLLKLLTFAPGFAVSGLEESDRTGHINFYYSSFTLPPVVYDLDLRTFAFRKTADKTVVTFDYEKYRTELVNYPGKDGVPVPMLLVYKEGFKRDGTRPVLLNSYGGFGIVSRSEFSPPVVRLLEQGALFAYAYIRGEGAKGLDWAMQGRGVNKQTSFDDFIAAGEYLVKNKYTSPSRLGIIGGSNGGLVVGAAITQRPDLFSAAIAQVGLFDVLTFENYTVGRFHKDEYGTIGDTVALASMKRWSPYQQLKPTAKYPAMLFITGDHDDRVPPFQSFKMAARMQALNPERPVLLRTLAKAGHRGDPTRLGNNRIDAEELAFLFSIWNKGPSK